VSSDPTFRHEALLYAGSEEFVKRVAPFVREGVEAGEPVLVFVREPKIAMLRDELGADANAVRFADMATVGRNPGRIIAEWREFVRARSDGHALRGVDESLYTDRTPEERVEVHCQEALLNVALAGMPLWLVCPYDTDALPRSDIEIAIENHHAAAPGDWFRRALPPPPEDLTGVDFELRSLHLVRLLVDEGARAFGLDARRREECVLAVSEVATNSLVHGGGRGTFRCWVKGERFVCEVVDAGRIAEPLVGRIRPTPGQVGGQGLWLANQLADLVQLRSNERGTVVRIHVVR
jgi:anti-sigma regulatory factor (Ser/Thr protein kinase)